MHHTLIGINLVLTVVVELLLSPNVLKVLPLVLVGSKNGVPVFPVQSRHGC